ncbi:MAG TPA: kelch repeat-containing protein, partial [Archangium sp.]
MAVSLALLTGCSCAEDPGLTPVEPAQLVVTPTRVSFPVTYVGQRATQSVDLTNRGGSSVTVVPFIDAPFSASPSEFTLVRGQSETVRIDFAPTRSGSFSGVLGLGELEVPVDAAALDVPECVAPAVCTVSTFDFATKVCRESLQADGTACETRCISGGCVRGECIGGLRGCDDANACTVDACSETTGCSHSPRTCPAVTDPCKVTACDPSSGCGAEPVPDGTLCGPDECKALQVDVCLAGECVKRPRPMTGRCANRWVPTTIPGRRAHAMAYDSTRHRVVLFGGAGPLGDTWEWDGTRWVLRLPANSPPARAFHAMAFDPVRQRVVLFGGRGENDQPLDDTWEWDGTNWVRRFVNSSPSARSEHAMAFDPVRQRVLLVSGLSATGPLQDLWKWNGGAWVLRTSTLAPPARHGHTIAFDPTRSRLVLFGGRAGAQFFADTWEWDGASWADRSTNQPVWLAPSARAFARLGYDLVGRRMFLIGGQLPDGRAVSEMWEWDGTNWGPTISPVPYFRAQHALVTDTDRQRLVLFGGSENGSSSLAGTVEWDGTTWRSFSTPGPGTIDAPAMATDPLRKRTLLFHGTSLWEWDGVDWLERFGRSPPGRYGTAMAFDVARQRLVLVGGAVSSNLS